MDSIEAILRNEIIRSRRLNVFGQKEEKQP